MPPRGGVPAACGAASIGVAGGVASRDCSPPLVPNRAATVGAHWSGLGGTGLSPPSACADGGRRASSFSQCGSLPGVMCRGEFGGAGRKPRPTSVGADDGDTPGCRNLCWKRS